MAENDAEANNASAEGWTEYPWLPFIIVRMFRRERKGSHARNQPKQGDKPYRDLYDWLMFVVGALGVAGIVATLWLTHKIANDTSRDTSSAINTMARIAGSLQKQQAAIINQSEATENLASETNTVAISTKEEADTSATNAETAQAQLATANKQLSQNVTLFAAQHRPIMIVDLMGDTNQIGREGNRILWNFNFKNVGAGPAYNVFYYEAISLNGGPFQERLRKGSKLDPPNMEHWSTAAYVLKLGEAYGKPALRVRFVYSDVLGKRYENTSCVIYEGDGVIRDCTEPQPYRRAKPRHGRPAAFSN